MPGEVAWSIEGGESGTFEILFPDEATSFLVYDEEHDIYRVLVMHCDSADETTKLFQFEKTDEIDLDDNLYDLYKHCDDESQFEEMEHQRDCLIETHVKPDVRLHIFVGHQAVFSES